MRSLLKKQAVWPKDYDFKELGKMANLRRMTADLVSGSRFPSLEDYLNGYAITGGQLDAPEGAGADHHLVG